MLSKGKGTAPLRAATCCPSSVAAVCPLASAPGTSARGATLGPGELPLTRTKTQLSWHSGNEADEPTSRLQNSAALSKSHFPGHVEINIMHGCARGPAETSLLQKAPPEPGGCPDVPAQQRGCFGTGRCSPAPPEPAATLALRVDGGVVHRGGTEQAWCRYHEQFRKDFPTEMTAP